MSWDDLYIIALLAAGGATGTVLRYAIGRVLDSTTFPLGTFAVNIIGSFLLALLFFYFLQGPGVTTEIRFFLFVGLFGAFTTMSTFTVDTVSLYGDGHYGLAFLNFLLNGVLCIGGAFAGRYVAGLF